MDYLYGILDLSFWGYVIVTIVMVQVTMMAVTLYLHRDQAHRAIDLNPALRHFFRFWIWCTSGMLTREGCGASQAPRLLRKTRRSAQSADFRDPESIAGRRGTLPPRKEQAGDHREVRPWCTERLA
jgi:hypothetical protein